MKICTKPYGEIEVSEKQRVRFPEGIIGFKDIHDYFLLDSREGPFYWLQAQKDPDLAFLLIDPRLFMPDYRLEVSESDLKSIGIKTEDDILDFAIVTVPDDHAKISANLMGPIVINRKNHTAKQVISTNDDYTVKHYIMEEMRKKSTDLVETR